MPLDFTKLTAVEDSPIPSRKPGGTRERVDSPFYDALLASYWRTVQNQPNPAVSVIVDTDEEVKEVRNAVTLAATQITKDHENGVEGRARVGAPCVAETVKDGKRTRIKVTFQGVKRKAFSSRVKKTVETAEATVTATE